MEKIKLTEKQIKDYMNIDNLDVPFEYPDGEEEDAIIFFGKNNKDFLKKYIDLAKLDMDVNTAFAIEFGYLEFCAEVKSVASKGVANEAQIFMFDYVVSGKAWDDIYG
tara:strand:+ start:231 stop:554 length:324 start_codon:yes stop_codon:yes gene_type:complete